MPIIECPGEEGPLHEQTPEAGAAQVLSEIHDRSSPGEDEGIQLKLLQAENESVDLGQRSWSAAAYFIEI
jgi:hypothetical protein